MPNATTIAPDGATISIPSTGTPLDQIHLAAALDHYTSNYLGSLDITHSPDFTQNSDRMAAPTMPSPALTASRPAPVVPATRATAPLQSTASAQNTASAQSAAPLRAQSKTPRRHAVSQQATFLNPLVNNDPGDTIGRFSDATEAAQRAYTAAPTPQNEQALRTAYANELTNLDCTGATRRTPQLKQYADRVRASGWDKPRTTMPATPAQIVPYSKAWQAKMAASGGNEGLDEGDLTAFKVNPKPFLDGRSTAITHYQHLLQQGRATPADTAQYAASIKKNMDALQRLGYFSNPAGQAILNDTVKAGAYKPSGPHTPRTPLQDIGHAIGVDIFGTGPHRGAFGLFGQGLLRTGDMAIKLVGKDPAQYMQPTPEAASYVALNSQKQAMRAAVASPLGLVMPDGTMGVFPAAGQALTGHGAQAMQTLAAVPGQMKDAFDETKPGGNPFAATLSYIPALRLGGRLLGGAGAAARIGGDIRQWDLTPPPDLQGLAGAAHAPMPTSFSPSLGPLEAYGPAAGQTRAAIQDIGSKGGSTRPPGGGPSAQPGSPTPPYVGGSMHPPQPPTPHSPILNIATMPGSAKGQLYDDILHAHRRLVNSIINPRTGGITALEEAGIPHRVLTTEGTSTTQRWGKEPNIHVELTGATEQTAKRAAAILGKSFRQDGVGIHYSVSRAEDAAAEATAKANAPLSQGLHRVLAVMKKDNSTWTHSEIDKINRVARRYNVELQTSPDGRDIEFHDYGSAFAPNPVKAGQRWQRQVDNALESAGLENSKYHQEVSTAKSDYVDQSAYRQHLAGNHQGTIKAAAKTHRIVFNRITGQPSRQTRRSMR